MYWDKEARTVLFEKNDALFQLDLCGSRPELPPIPNTNVLVSYLHHIGTSRSLSEEQMFYMKKRQMLDLLNDADGKYRHIVIKKTGGKPRDIYSPCSRLRLYQHWINENILSELDPADSAYAYRCGRSAVSCADKHVGQPTVLRLDISVFFDSITEKQVYGVFHNICGYESGVSKILSLICTRSGKLPQGAITSPALSNLVLKRLDEQIERFCGKHHITYTRYSDDMYFSGSFAPKHVTNHVRGLLKREGFSLNDAKTRVMPYYCRQGVLGVTVNAGTAASRDYRRKLRKEIYYIRKHGVREHILEINAKAYIKNGKVQRKKYLRHLLGQVNYANFVKPSDAFADYRRYLLRCLRKEHIVGWYSPEELASVTT